MSSRRKRTRRAGEDRADRSLGCASVPTCVPSCPGAGPPERALDGSQNMDSTQEPPYAALGSMCEISKAYAEASTAPLRVAPTCARRNQQLPRVKRRQNGGKWREWEASCAYSLTGCRAALASVFVFPPVSSVASSESVLRAQDAHRCVSDMRDPAYLVSEAWTHLETAQNRPFRVCCLRADLLEAVGLARKRGGSGWAERAVGRHFRDSHPMLAFGLFTFCIYN